MELEMQGPAPVPKQFVLCFDGTGNKFCGDESDSNVLKIFRMLDRSKSHQFHYYQPGIGTYVTSKSLSSHGRFQRIRSAYLKAKDSAIGSSFAEHVMGGYKFLMRYYSPGDEIYFIGFSRGAYIARFLAEMLDYIGLLEAGNEELVRFAWKTFAKWQQRRGGEEEDEEQKRLFTYMKAFRETFSRPITRIRFMGLFDTVNSVPAFESAWMQRSKFPYTARSSARVIRHAVGIDERRAKFRQDLISESRPWTEKKRAHRWKRHMPHHMPHHHNAQEQSEKENTVPAIVVNGGNQEQNGPEAGAEPRPSRDGTESVYRSLRSSHESLHHANHRYRAPAHHPRRPSLAVPMPTASTEDLASIRSGQSGLSLQIPPDQMSRVTEEDDFFYEDETKQDIQEVWFPGGHADIGGGWKLDGEEVPLSHAPLVWMVQEAEKAGLQFDKTKVKQFECCEEFDGEYSPIGHRNPWNRSNGFCQDPEHQAGHDEKPRSQASINFHKALRLSSEQGLLHDCLSFGNGLPAMSVLSWRIMEYLPFRRMDLQADGSWKPIRWPLPCGEVRDIPNDAQIHVSAIRRMRADPNYRPGNLIVGGGGRGVRRAPEELGMGQWEVKAYHGDAVREVYVRKKVSSVCRDETHE
ncbi:conserved hypothetical protein [Aspergillus terreus NIH2624]|uniref:T6SS Phospholipase effector Tle1-like catalytic domain-containing protein n=1 Tax=Aspergillus terreus (strain NIH 2624 / FGSC A1156) TaxID=341663 RepID=Q0CNH8_ASPTN|nr:uncharacterized protein ATEG_04756 [Aspergillus terreus NIH2624]EAU35203.1 conserved hypothetical protein [Aspergillus terreus NIH2624]